MGANILCAGKPAVLVCTVVSLALLGCEGPAGPSGETGEAGVNGVNGVNGTNGTNGTNGVNGVNGTNGTNGKDVAALAYAGSEKCKTCHATQYNQWVKSGHKYKLTAVAGGTRPTDPPFSKYPANPPKDDNGKQWTWAEVSYIIGGFGWKARFVDKDGYIITGKAVQWNLETQAWSAYHGTEKPGTKKYDCGSCHTTGYNATKTHKLKGIVGDWAEPGVGCEECHGPGTRHIASKGMELMKVDRTATGCGKCHVREDPYKINASGGFIQHHEQWEELYSSKKQAMNCVDCHNPHQSARYKDTTVNPNKGINRGCVNCHFKMSKGKVSKHGTFVKCIDCHMPEAAKSAVGDATKWDGDVKSHLFAINTDITAKQFTTDGSGANPYLTLGFTCKKCHQTGGAGLVKTDAALEAAATGYHD